MTQFQSEVRINPEFYTDIENGKMYAMKRLVIDIIKEMPFEDVLKMAEFEQTKHENGIDVILKARLKTDKILDINSKMLEMLEEVFEMCNKNQFPTETELKTMAKKTKQLIKEATEV